MKMRPRAQDCDAAIDPATREWPYLATDVPNPAACLSQCRESFMAEVVAAPADDKAALCEAMNGTAQAGGDVGFGWLYCCSSVLCGVSFDKVTRSAGQDPNVKRIVDDCQNLGYTSVLDPGVPPDAFTCPASSVYTPDEPRACNLVGAADLKSSAPEPPSPTPSSATPRGPTPDADLTPSHDSTPGPSQPGLSTGVKAAIGVLSFLAFLALLSTLLYLLRRRHPTKHRRPRSAKAAHSPPSSSSSPSRLVPAPAPRAGTALSPPLRLKDRRLLPALMGHHHPPRREQQPRAAFPASPICAPTTSRLVPRNENAPLPPFSPAGPRPSTSPASSLSPGSPRASADPPARPPRPHDAPLRIPDLVAPACPPPGRALPGTPGAGPRADIGVAVSRHGQAAAGRDPVDERGGARASWGSWGTRVVSPVLGEDELERMGGRYT